MKDFRGEVIEAGTKIVYPVRHGSSVAMKEATVEWTICPCGHYSRSNIFSCYYGGGLGVVGNTRGLELRVIRDGKKLKLTNLKNVVVVR